MNGMIGYNETKFYFVTCVNDHQISVGILVLLSQFGVRWISNRNKPCAVNVLADRWYYWMSVTCARCVFWLVIFIVFLRYVTVHALFDCVNIYPFLLPSLYWFVSVTIRVNLSLLCYILLTCCTQLLNTLFVHHFKI